MQNATVTISFRAKANNANAGYTGLIVRTRTVAGVDGAAIFAGTASSTNITLTTSDAYYTVTRTLPATFGALSLEFVINSHVAGDGFEITGVQLEAGSVATPFEHRPIGQELALCQRYYQQHTQPALRGVAGTYSDAFRMGMVLPVVMRAAPTATTGAFRLFDGVSVVTVTTTLANYSTNSVAEFDFGVTPSVLVIGRPVIAYQDTNGTTLKLSAEL